MRGLKFFTKTSQVRTWVIASYHSPHSLTWSWCLDFHLFSKGERVIRRSLYFAYRNHPSTLQWGVVIPFIGLIYWNRQQPMWYRDLWRRQNDEIFYRHIQVKESHVR